MKHLGRHPSALNESKRVRIDPGLYRQLGQLVERLWGMRRRGIETVKYLGAIRFRTLDGTEAMMRVYVDPEMMDYWGMTDTDPKFSRDPMDLVVKLCHPWHFSTRRDLMNVLVHETLHALDPGETTALRLRDHIGYKWWSSADDADYLSHRGEYMTIYSDFLDAVVRTFGSMRRTHSPAKRLAMLDEILAFFKSGGPGRVPLPHGLMMLFQRVSRDRDLLGQIEDIRRYRPEAHRAFLQKLYDTVGEIRSSISNHGPQGA